MFYWLFFTNILRSRSEELLFSFACKEKVAEKGWIESPSPWDTEWSDPEQSPSVQTVPGAGCPVPEPLPDCLVPQGATPCLLSSAAPPHTWGSTLQVHKSLLVKTTGFLRSSPTWTLRAGLQDRPFRDRKSVV